MWKKEYESDGCFTPATTTGKIFFGFGIADSMFSGDVDLRRRPLTPAEVRAIVATGLVVPCLNPSHSATIAIMRSQFKIEVEIPATAPVVRLEPGDTLIVMGVAGLPRLEGRHEYTATEVAGARWSFASYAVSAVQYGPGHSAYDAEGDEE